MNGCSCTSCPTAQMETDKSLTITVSSRSDEMLGIIGGSGLWNTPLFKEFQEEIVRTEHGRGTVPARQR